MPETEHIFYLGGWGYALAAAGYLLLALLLLTSWRGRVQGGLLLGVSVSSALWGGWLAYSLFHNFPVLASHIWLELIRDGFALFFLYKVLTSEQTVTLQARQPLKWLFRFALIVWLGLWLLYTYASFVTDAISGLIGYDFRFVGHLMLAVVGLVLVEQLFRNTHPQHRWAIKYLCLGFGALFVYDFFMYSNAVLFGVLELRHWNARGYVHMLVVPLLAISAARNPQWSLEIFVSRRVVFHSVAILGAGSYLLLMALGGYAIKYWGGSWGGIAQLIFLVGAALVLFALLFSGQVRAKFKVFLSKHFFNYKYDYREEWLKLIGALESVETSDGDIRQRSIMALANIVDSPAGGLWLANETGDMFQAKSEWNLTGVPSRLPKDELLQFVKESHWLVDLNEYRESPEAYSGMKLPAWVEEINNAWLIIPLFQANSLFGLVLLVQPRAYRSINWEDRDLLKTAATQVASYLALSEASARLADARQFEAFNRLSAYVVHDLKNVVGQLSLVVSNAKRFSHNQDFVEDAFSTVDNAVNKMQKMLSQLRQGRAVEQSATAVKLAPIIRKVIDKRAVDKPTPILGVSDIDGELQVVADGDRLEAVIEHIVQNAQEATEDSGVVRVTAKLDNSDVIIEIEDSGCGMDADFIRHRLFKPFDTTKGNAGMGIGVYESREFIQALGGEMRVESTPGVGSVFRLGIPVKE